MLKRRTACLIQRRSVGRHGINRISGGPYRLTSTTRSLKIGRKARRSVAEEMRGSRRVHADRHVRHSRDWPRARDETIVARYVPLSFECAKLLGRTSAFLHLLV